MCSDNTESKSRQVPASSPGCSPWRERELLGARCSHGVVEHDILLGELQQHGVVKELADAHVFAQALQRVGANTGMGPVASERAGGPLRAVGGQEAGGGGMPAKLFQEPCF